jgi:hypothetical protein
MHSYSVPVEPLDSILEGKENQMNRNKVLDSVVAGEPNENEIAMVNLKVDGKLPNKQVLLFNK